MADATNIAASTAVELSSAQEDAAFKQIAALSGDKISVISSLEGSDEDTKLAVLSAVQDATPLRDHLGKTISLVHFAAQVVEINEKDSNNSDIVDPLTGEVKTLTTVRIIMIDDKGDSYASISKGVAKALENIVGIMGKPSIWTKPVKIKAVEAGNVPRRYLTLKSAK